jgi:hypothetical protein
MYPGLLRSVRGGGGALVLFVRSRLHAGFAIGLVTCEAKDFEFMDSFLFCLYFIVIFSCSSDSGR